MDPCGEDVGDRASSHGEDKKTPWDTSESYPMTFVQLLQKKYTHSLRFAEIMYR